jgi:preprotein translocase subunit SecD
LWLGSGPIAGFAKTLLIGVIISFISAIVATRAMIKAIASVDLLKKKWLYGAKGGEAKNA